MEETTKRSTAGSPTLQVMICTYGREGLARVAASSHPRVEGVEYLVSMQEDPDGEECRVPKELDREDFRIFSHISKGLSINRNVAISKATAPLLLISDDDVDYTEEGLLAVIDAFNKYAEADLITFRYDTMNKKKKYPAKVYDISVREKEHFISSIEIAFRRESVQGKIWFNENFGIGAIFPSGEEDIFIRDCLDAGRKGIFLPVTIARHDGMTTSGRNLMLPSRPQTKGAVFLRLYPRQWPLRMIAHAIREIPLWKKGLVPSPLSYCINWIKGANMARKKNVFPTPDYSLHYPCHE